MREVLIVGEERGAQAKTVFMGFGLGALYKFLVSWPASLARGSAPRVRAHRRRRTHELFGEIQAEISPELTGVGYIIGPRIAGYLFGGGVLSWFALIPAIKFFGAGLTADLSAGHELIATCPRARSARTTSTTSARAR